MATFEAGKCYSIQVRGQHSDNAHDGGTLNDPKVKVMNFYDYYHSDLYDPNTLAYVGVPADMRDVAYYDKTYINPSNFELLNQADKICNMVSPSDQPGDYKLVCNYYCDDDSGPGNNSLIKVRVNTGGRGRVRDRRGRAGFDGDLQRVRQGDHLPLQLRVEASDAHPSDASLTSSSRIRMDWAEGPMDEREAEASDGCAEDKSHSPARSTLGS